MNRQEMTALHEQLGAKLSVSRGEKKSANSCILEGVTAFFHVFSCFQNYMATNFVMHSTEWRSASEPASGF